MSLSRLVFTLFVLSGLGAAAFPVWAQSAGPLPTATAAVEAVQWDGVLGEFEKEVAQRARALSGLRDQQTQLHKEIERLEVKTTAIRNQNQNGSNLLDQIRLNNLLKELQKKLETDSQLQRQWKDGAELFEQKSLSLISLYNDRIEDDLDSTSPESAADRLRSLIGLVRKRQDLQKLIDQFPKTQDEGEMPALPSIQRVDGQDLEGLRLTLDLLTDRQKDLQERIEKSTVQQAETKQELKLQVKMKDFLEDVQRMNEDSDFPHDSLSRNDLGAAAGKKQKDELEKKLQEISNGRDRDEKNLEQLKAYMANVQSQILSLRSEN